MEEQAEINFALPDRREFIDPEFRFLSDSELPLPAGGFIVPSPGYIKSLLQSLKGNYRGLVIGYNLNYVKTSLELNDYFFTYRDLSETKKEQEKIDLQEKAPYDLLILQNIFADNSKDYENLLAASYTLIMPLENENSNQTVVMIKMSRGIPDIKILGSYSLLRTF